MKSVELKAFRVALLALRSRLRDDVSTMASTALPKNGSAATSALSGMPTLMADVGSDGYEQEFTLSLMANEEGTLDLIAQALERIRTKRYGTCEECGGVIAKKRLEALPFAAFCIRCAEKQEHGFAYRPGQPR